MENTRYLLRKSKTDPFGKGKLIPIPNKLAEVISHWQNRFKQTDGYILRSFKRDLSARGSLDPAALNEVLKLLQRKAKLHNIGELSGHSFRVGAAVALSIEVCPLRESCFAADGSLRILH
jgi:integrase